MFQLTESNAGCLLFFVQSFRDFDELENDSHQSLRRKLRPGEIWSRWKRTSFLFATKVTAHKGASALEDDVSRSIEGNTTCSTLLGSAPTRCFELHIASRESGPASVRPAGESRMAVIRVGPYTFCTTFSSITATMPDGLSILLETSDARSVST